MITKKIDDYTLEVETDKTVTTKAQHSKTYLLAQRAAILKQKAEQMAQRDAEVAEVDALLAEAVRLGIKEDDADKNKPPVPEPVA